MFRGAVAKLALRVLRRRRKKPLSEASREVVGAFPEDLAKAIGILVITASTVDSQVGRRNANSSR